MANKPDRGPALEAFERLLGIIDDLRAQCPWDKVQTEQTLRILTIEETYELADAIDAGDWSELGKELGDLFLHLVFYSKIASEQGHFDVADVLHGVCDKLVRRHPHIYGDVNAEDAEAVKANWEAIKLAEKGSASAKSVLDGVPKALPALVKAYRMQDKVRGVGFDWPSIDGVWEKVEEELVELRTAPNDAAALEELGDLLFALVNYARHRGWDPEQALAQANDKFLRRFKAMESLLAERGDANAKQTLEVWDSLWNQVKRNEN
ncbi:MAG: nucleoside triphosphate pyrophosphohydrolase [Bacteroidetes bacterium]|nr:nucleoside triphosphate pyrophosphohydrolase [Bacteroidota bacterium]